MKGYKNKGKKGKVVCYGIPGICSVIPFDWYEEMKWDMEDALYTGPVKHLSKEEIDNLIKKGELS